VNTAPNSDLRIRGRNLDRTVALRLSGEFVRRSSGRYHDGSHYDLDMENMCRRAAQ
jgi:hypothetical protein